MTLLIGTNNVAQLTSTEASRPVRDGDEWEKGERRVKPRDRRQPGRPRLPWTSARTTKCKLWHCQSPPGIAQQLPYHAIAVPTAMQNRVTDKDNVRNSAVGETAEAKEVQLSSPAPPLCAFDLFWANLWVQHHLPLLDVAWTRRSVQLLRESSAHLHPLDLAWTDLAKVEVALLSELGFKHQVTTAGGGGRGGGGGSMRCRGVLMTGSGMEEGREGEV